MLKCMSGKQTNRTELKQFIYGKIAHSTHSVDVIYKQLLTINN